jgi:hypothetical protein
VEVKEYLAWDNLDTIYDPGSLQDISADELTNRVGRQPSPAFQLVSLKSRVYMACRRNDQDNPFTAWN